MSNPDQYTSSAHDMASSRTGFLDLPSEIRNSSYELALVKPGPILVEARHGNGAWHRGVWQGQVIYIKRVALYTRSDENTELATYSCDATTFQAGMLVTCRQIHSEATPVLYGANNFFISFRHNHANLPEPLLHDNNLKHIRHLTFGDWGQTLKDLIATMVTLKKQVKKFKQLRKITISLGAFPTTDFTATDLAKKFAPFLRAVGRVRRLSIEKLTKMVEFDPDDYAGYELSMSFLWEDGDRIGEKVYAGDMERSFRETLKEMLEPKKKIKKSSGK